MVPPARSLLIESGSATFSAAAIADTRALGSVTRDIQAAGQSGRPRHVPDTPLLVTEPAIRSRLTYRAWQRHLRDPVRR